MLDAAEITFQLSAQCPTHSRTHVRAGSHDFVTDEPAALGGTDLGPTPVQTLIASLLGATNVLLHRIAHKHHVSLEGLKLSASATLDLRGVKLQTEIDVPLSTIRLTIDVSSPSAEAALQAVRADLRRYCPVSKMLRAAGTEIEDIWIVNGSPALAREAAGSVAIR
jgi:uncharacterized OsmC-like protein